MNVLWAVPLIGLIAKVIVLIPHFIGLSRLPWQARTYAYLFGLTDRYPPFSMTSPDSPANSAGDIPVPSPVAA
jgi:hypothetical protein